MVVYKKGHKNSKGEAAPWTIVSHETGKILSSHKSKKKAEEHLRQMEYYKHINESVFSEYLDTLPDGILFESIRQSYNVLFEASESDAYRYFEKELKTLDPKILERLKRDIQYMLEDTHTEVDPSISWVRILFKQFQTDFGIKGTEALYFLPGMARIVFRQLDRFEYEPKTTLSSRGQLFRDIVKYITLGHKDEYTRYLVDKNTGEQQTFESLKHKYGPALKTVHNKKIEDLKSLTYTPNDYKVVELTDFETAHKFSKYATAEEWCHLAHEDMFNYYRQGGYVRLYLAVKPGFENLKPGDKGYGASMLGIDVGPNNKLIHCNNRYNHAKDPELDNEKNHPGDDRYDMKELSLMLGAPFYEFCPYYTREQMHEMGIIDFNEVEEKIAEGVPPEEFGTVFEAGALLRSGYGMMTKVNLPTGYKLLDIPIKAKYFPHKAIITPDNKILGDQWFEDIMPFGQCVAIKTYDDEGDTWWVPMSLATGELNENIKFNGLMSKLKLGSIVNRLNAESGNNEYNILSHTTGEMVLDNWVAKIKPGRSHEYLMIIPKVIYVKTNVLLYNKPYIIDENLHPVEGMAFEVIETFDRFEDEIECHITCDIEPDESGCKFNLLSQNFDRRLLKRNYEHIIPGLDDQVILYTKCAGGGPEAINDRWYVARTDGTILSNEEYTGKIKPLIIDKHYQCENASGLYIVDSNGERKYSHTTTRDNGGKPLEFIGYERLSKVFSIIKASTTDGDGAYTVYNLYNTQEQKMVFDTWYQNIFYPGLNHRLVAFYTHDSVDVLFDAVDGKVLIENARFRHVSNGYISVRKDGLTNFLLDQDCKWLFDKWQPITFIEDRSWPITGIIEYQGKENIFSINRTTEQLSLASNTGFDSVEYNKDTHEYIATENGKQITLSRRQGNMPEA